MKESLERLMKLSTRRDLSNSEMNEVLKIFLVLASWALEMKAKCIMSEQDRREMVIMILSLLTSRVFQALNIEQRNIIINPTDPDDDVYGDMENPHFVGNC